MRLEIAQRAREDMFKVQSDGIVKFGILHSDRFFDGLTDLFKLIAHSPYMAPERHEFSQAVRLHPYKSLIIAYRIENETVKILRVVYGRQDLKAIL
jgi:toxin ParE1/3/4